MSAPIRSPKSTANISRRGPKSSETNTYGASRLRLAAQGLDDKLLDINVNAVRLARKATESAKHDVFVPVRFRRSVCASNRMSRLP
ncbi:MAG: homocysteine S-methyltransferase family protein [Acidobacteriota bacterium]